MTEPTQTPTEKQTKKRGIRTFENDSFTLVLNKETKVYDLSFEGRQLPIRFVAPAGMSVLAEPLKAGLVHRSGRHAFNLGFSGDRLVAVINQHVIAGFSEGVELPLTESVQVPVESDLAQWIVVSVEMSVVKALRTK